MANIINLKSSFDAPTFPTSWVMVAARSGLGVKAWGQNTMGGHPADALRFDTGWLQSFDEAMKRAREWAAEQQIETIYVEEGADTAKRHK